MAGWMWGRGACQRDPAEFDMYQQQDVRDTTIIWRFLPELKRRVGF